MMLMRVAFIVGLVCFTKGDVKKVTHDDLLQKGGVFFTEKGINHFSTLLFDRMESGYDILVGAKNRLYRFNVSYHLKEKIALAPTPAKTKQCQSARNSMNDCNNNFIKVLVSSNEGDKIFVCGTSAFSPVCEIRRAKDVSILLGTLDAKNKVPYNSEYPAVSYMGQRLFLGSVFNENEETGGRIVITDWATGRHVATKESKNNLFRASFVGVFEEDKFVFFVFREMGIDSPTKTDIYSRIGRVCKDEQGLLTSVRYYMDGSRHEFNERLSSFTKVRLECGGYDQVQGAVYDHTTSILYATFISNTASKGSALCAFTYATIEAAFKGGYKCWTDIDSSWKPCVDDPWDPSVPTCFGTRAVPTMNHHVIHFNAIKPECQGPMYKNLGAQFSAIDVSPDTAGTLYAYISDEKGQVWMLGPLECKKTAELELWEVISPTSANTPVTTHVLSVKHGGAFLLMDDGVVMIPHKTYKPNLKTEKATMSTMSSSSPEEFTKIVNSAKTSTKSRISSKTLSVPIQSRGGRTSYTVIPFGMMLHSLKTMLLSK